MKKIFNFFGIIISFVLSLVLFVELLVVPVVSATTSFTQIDNLKKIVSQIDLSQLEFTDENGADAELLNQLLEGDLMAELLELYVEDIFMTLEDNGGERIFTVEALKAVCEEHMEELLPIVKEVMKEELTLPDGSMLKDEDLEKVVLQLINEEADNLIQEFPTVEDLGITEEVILGLKYLREGMVWFVFIGAAAVLSLLILLFRCVQFKGFVWLGVVYFLAGGINLLAAVALQKSGSALAEILVPETEGIIAPIISVLGTEMFKGAAVIGLFAVAFICIYVVTNKASSKKVVEGIAEI